MPIGLKQLDDKVIKLKEVSNQFKYQTTGLLEERPEEIYSREKILILGELLNSHTLASDLFFSITDGVNNLGYKKFHMSILERILKIHIDDGNSSIFSDFQKTVIKFKDAAEKKSPSNIEDTFRIIRKIYKYFEKSEKFIIDDKSKNVLIFDKQQVNAKEIMMELRALLGQYSPSEEISKATRLFISSKKVEKNYLRIIVKTFLEISKLDPAWPPYAIKQGIENFRDSFDTIQNSLNTKYHEVSRVLELFSYLKNVGLIDKGTVLPKNIKRPSSSSLMRNTNPTISSIDIDSLDLKHMMSSAQSMIDLFHIDLETKLKTLTETARSFVLSHYRKHESNKTQQQYGMEADLICAMHIIIVNEMGINPTSLYNLKVDIEFNNNQKNEFIKVEDDGSVRINVIKWRQRRLQKRTCEPLAYPPYSELTLDDVNTAFCIKYAILLTDLMRIKLKTNLLWLKLAQNKIKKSLTFDAEFRNFCDKYLPHEFSILKPTLMRLRSSRAMVIYMSTDGDVIKTAAYLGNKVKTTLSTYIPRYLQEIIYRRKISVFQHLYLFLATAKEPDKLKTLGLSEEQYNDCLKEIYKNEDFGGTLFEKLTPCVDKKNYKDQPEVLFICSPQNFAFAIKLLKTSESKNSEIYKICLNAIKKVSSGSILQKKMLLEAEDILLKEGFLVE